MNRTVFQHLQTPNLRLKKKSKHSRRISRHRRNTQSRPPEKFGSLYRLRIATLEQIAEVPGFGGKAAMELKKSLEARRPDRPVFRRAVLILAGHYTHCSRISVFFPCGYGSTLLA